MKHSKGQTYLPLNRFTVQILKTNRRANKSWYVAAGSSSKAEIAQQILVSLIAEGYTGHVRDETTGRHWTADQRWHNTRSPNP